MVETLHLTLKSIHIIAMVTWFAGLFYLPRLFVYHAMSDYEPSKDQFNIMQYKLFWYITTPGGVVTTITGLSMVNPVNLSKPWLQVKLFCVFLLWVFHISCGFFVKKFQVKNVKQSHVFFRFFNEFPTLVLIVVIFSIVFKY